MTLSAKCFWRSRFRFFILLLGLLCLTSIFSNMITLNITIICMEKSFQLMKFGGRDGKGRTSFVYNKNGSTDADQLLLYTQHQKSLLQWSVALASMLATFPFSWLCTRYGARNVFFISGLLSALSTALIPAAAEFSFFAFVCVRIVQGLAYACDFAVIGVLCTRWASLKENAKFLGFLTCFSPLSTCITNSVSGVICESETFGWPWVNYFHAIASLILFLAWFFFYTDDPRKNRFVSAHEVTIIHRGKTDSHINMDGSVPYLVIFKDKVVLAVWLNAFSDLFCAFFLIIYLPIIFKKLLNFGIVQVGLILGVVSIVNVPVKIAAGFISDNFFCLSERRKMWFFNSMAVLLPAIIFGYLALVPELQPITSVVLFAGIFGFVGFNCGGFYKCGALVSRQYAEFVIAFTQFIKCVVYFVAPALVSIFVDDEYNLREWQIIFGITSALLIISNLMFCIYATDEPRPFTKPKEEAKTDKVMDGGQKV